MRAFNVVRFRVKPGFETSFVEHHRNLTHGFEGFLGGALVATGDRGFCLVGEWRSYESIAAARPQMLASLDAVRGMLEDLGGGLGVTDPVSGEVAASLAPSPGLEPAPPAPRAARPARKKAKKKAKVAKKKAKKKVARKAGKKKARKAAKKRGASKKAKPKSRKKARRGKAKRPR
jgi:hypothetical protein